MWEENQSPAVLLYNLDWFHFYTKDIRHFTEKEFSQQLEVCSATQL